MLVMRDDERMRTASPLAIEAVTPEALRKGDTQDITLVFLRHRGCLFTRDWVQEMRPLWPEAEAVSDPDALLNAAWSVERGGFRAMFGLRSWLAGIPAFLRGNRIGWRLQAGEVVWMHRGTHAGDHPDLGGLT